MATTSFDTKHNAPRTSHTTKADARRAMAGGAAGDRLLDDTYKDGLKEGRRQARKAKPAQHGPAKVARAAHRSVSRGANQGLSSGLAPVQSQVAGGVKTLTMGLGVVALYLFLQSATAVTGALGGVKRGLAWLSSPNHSIPYAGK